MYAKKPPETESFDAAELGAMMREMRENLGHELDAVARDLRIRLVYLEAIESGRLSDLPGNAYVSGFLRSYSDFLGLEGDEIVRRFKMAGAEISSQPRLHLPSPVEEGRLPTASILLVAAVIAAAAYGGWYYLSGTGKGPMETVASLPEELSGLVDDAKNQTAPTEVAKSPAAPDAISDTGGPGSRPSDAASETPNAASATPPSEQSTETVPANTVASAAPASTPTMAAGNPPTASPTTSPPTPSTTPTTTPAPPPTSARQTESAAAMPERPAAAVTAPTPAPTPAPKPAEKPVATAVVPATPAEPPRPAEPAAASVPEPAMQTPAPTPAVTAVAVPAVDTAVRTAAIAPSQSPDPAPGVTGNPAPTGTASRSSSDTPSSSGPSSFGSSAGGIRIVVRATTDSYVAVRTGDNQPLFSQLMRRGDSYEVPSGADLILETGNAGGLQITVGGKRAPSLGPIGEIRRNIPLDAAKLLSGIN